MSPFPSSAGLALDEHVVLVADRQQARAPLTGGEGVDAAIEAFGFPETFEGCLRVTKAGGRVSNIGYHGENPNPLQLPLDAFGLGMNDKAIHTGLCPGGVSG